MLGNVCAVSTGLSPGAGRGESHLVVDHEMYGASVGEVGHLRELEGLLVDALSDHGCVAVNLSTYFDEHAYFWGNFPSFFLYTCMQTTLSPKTS